MLNISDERARTKMGILSVRFIEYLTVFIVAVTIQRKGMARYQASNKA